MKADSPNVMVLDDDEEIAKLISLYLQEDGVKVQYFSSPLQLLKHANESSDSPPDLLISDIKMPEMSGLEIIEKLNNKWPQVPIVLMTAHSSIDIAIQAMRKGAFDFLVKPIRKSDLKVCVDRAIKFSSLQQENTVLRKEIRNQWSAGEIIGKSPAFQSILDLTHRVARTAANVLITGESGTGKEVIARAIHMNSARAKLPFVAINCSAIPESLLESELFGHSRGSFTGATANRKGLFEEAEDGTIFLDEIGDMDFALQAKLLRVLQEKKVKPVGENRYRKVNACVIAATHKDLKKAVKDGSFREDLYYRLSVIPIEIPPLRERKEDIPLLAEHFLARYAATYGLKLRGFSKKALATLLEHKWEGNVRELENVVERSAVLCDGEWIEDVNLPNNSGHASTELLTQDKRFFSVNVEHPVSLKEIENQYIQYILEKTKHHKEQAAQILGVDRKTLYRKEKESRGIEVHAHE